MHKLLKSVSMLTLLLALNVTSAQAEGDKGMHKRAEQHSAHVEAMFKKHDSNKDGVIKKDEIIAYYADQFKKLDGNSDGFISLDEMPKDPKALKHMMGRGNHNMRKDRHKEKFVIKTKEDGVETVLEGEAAKKHMERHPEKGGHKKAGRMTRMKAMVKMDRNGDETISLDEFTAKVPRHFKRKDTNGDGSITMEEALKGKPHEKKRHHKKKKKADKKR